MIPNNRDAKPLVVGRLSSRQPPRRQITEAEVAQVLAAPEQIEVVRSGRAVYQSRIGFGEPGRIYLLRVFVDTDRRPVEVVTAYRTSRIEKYGGEES